jgi:hypothetical protein
VCSTGTRNAHAHTLTLQVSNTLSEMAAGTTDRRRRGPPRTPKPQGSGRASRPSQLVAPTSSASASPVSSPDGEDSLQLKNSPRLKAAAGASKYSLQLGQEDRRKYRGRTWRGRQVRGKGKGQQRQSQEAEQPNLHFVQAATISPRAARACAERLSAAPRRGPVDVPSPPPPRLSAEEREARKQNMLALSRPKSQTAATANTGHALVRELAAGHPFPQAISAGLPAPSARSFRPGTPSHKRLRALSRPTEREKKAEELWAAQREQAQALAPTTPRPPDADRLVVLSRPARPQSAPPPGRKPHATNPALSGRAYICTWQHAPGCLCCQDQPWIDEHGAPLSARPQTELSRHLCAPTDAMHSYATPPKPPPGCQLAEPRQPVVGVDLQPMPPPPPPLARTACPPPPTLLHPPPVPPEPPNPSPPTVAAFPAMRQPGPAPAFHLTHPLVRELAEQTRCPQDYRWRYDPDPRQPGAWAGGVRDGRLFSAKQALS